ncbi:hypothetical protein OURE66S_02711 [Oligella ureolytica]
MKITYCLSPLAKLKGLLGKRSLEENHCYVFVPCKAIHTFGMRFAIDVIFCDKTGHLLKYYRQLPPNRIVFVSRAFFTIELVSNKLLDEEQLNYIISACLAVDSHNKNHISWI